MPHKGELHRSGKSRCTARNLQTGRRCSAKVYHDNEAGLCYAHLMLTAEGVKLVGEIQTERNQRRIARQQKRAGNWIALMEQQRKEIIDRINRRTSQAIWAVFGINAPSVSKEIEELS